MTILYNHLSSKKDKITREEKAFWIYLCGPTVYDKIHLGNLRSLIVYDLLRRWLFFNKIQNKLCINITDIDDKIIRVAQDREKKLWEITNSNLIYFLKIYSLCNLLTPTALPLVTANMLEIINTIIKMKEKGVVIKEKDSLIFTGNEELNLNYGEISKRKEKRLDFAVWKFEDNPDYSWNSKVLGQGRPGWHTECVSLIDKYCGNDLKIHCGGIDLIFPHHENELIQLKALGYRNDNLIFSYVGQLIFRGEKMSKSLKNTLEIEKIIDEYGVNTIKYFFLKSKYSAPIYMENIEELKVSQNEINRILYRIKHNLTSIKAKDIDINLLPSDFVDSLNDNLNTVDALKHLKNFINTSQVEDKWNIAKKMVEILGFTLEDITSKENINSLLYDLYLYSEKLRSMKKYEFSDELRKILEKHHIQVFNDK